MRVFTLAVLSAAVVAALMVFPAARFRATVPTIIIHDDGGGLVGDYLKFYSMLRVAGIHVRIEGACVSACTLLLAMPPSEVCMLPDAKLGFHLSSLNGIPDRQLTEELAARFYPLPVQQWLIRRGPLKEAPIYMTGEEAVSLGVVRPCAA